MMFLRVLTITICLAASFSPYVAYGDDSGTMLLNAREALSQPGIKYDKKALERGKIVVVGRPDLEKAKSGLGVSLVMLLPVELERVAQAFMHNEELQKGYDFLANAELQGPANTEASRSAFSIVDFESTENTEVEKSMQADLYRSFNLDQEETRWFKAAADDAAKLGAQGADRVQPIVDSWRRVLASRYDAYLKEGLAAIRPYKLKGGKQFHPGRELTRTTEVMSGLKAALPDLHRALLIFPKPTQQKYESRFFVIKQIIEDRPGFVLKHWMLDSHPDHLVLVERLFYMSHTLNTMQVVIVAMPYDDKRTLVALTNQSFTEAVAGMGGKIAHAIGRKIVTGQILPLFENLQKAVAK
jgi:hypothetical protein